MSNPTDHTTNNRAELPLAFRLEHHHELDSTQDEMHRRLETGADIHGLVIQTERQTRGRGQRRYDWHSEPGGSYQTLALKDTQPPVLNTPHTALHMALGIATELQQHGVQARIKWPNDLYYLGKKLAGILAEYRHAHLLIGVGMNVENPVPDTATGLRGWRVEAVHALVLTGLKQGVYGLLSEQDLQTAFAPFDMLAGRTVHFERGGEILTGVACGIDSTGRLRLELPSGEVQAFSSGRVLNVLGVVPEMQLREQL